MVARLLIDALWRSRWIYVAMSVTLLPCWLMYVASGDNVLEISITALSLIFAGSMGPTLATTTMGVRALRHLPVGSRDLWRTTWVVATVVSAGVLLATKAISALLVAAFGGSPKVAAETFLLSAVYDFSWAGAMLPVFPVLAFEYAVVHRGRPAALLAQTWRAVVLLACFGLPILVAGALPTHVGEFTSVTIGVLIAGLAIAFGVLAWTPQRGVLAGERARVPRAVVLPGAATRTRLADRLTGISRVVIPHLLATLALPVGACLALASYGVISGSGPWWFVPQAATVFDPADTGDRGLTYIVLLPCGVVTMVGLWTPWTRLLKVLPLSVKQINALLLLTPFATWTTLWLVGWSAYAFAYGTPQTLRVEFAFGMASISALAHAALLRVQGILAMFWVVAFIGGLMPQVVKVGLRDGTGAQVVIVVIGAIALCTAALVNHHTLTRSTSASQAYRPRQAPFGMPTTPSIR